MINLPAKIAQTSKPVAAVQKQAPASLPSKPAPVMMAFHGHSDFVRPRWARPVALDGGGGGRPTTPAGIAQGELTSGDITGAKYKEWAKTGQQADWCASFVSWVYQQAGITIGPSPYGASGVNGIPHCDNLLKWFKEAPGWQWHPKDSGYQPKPGDVVLFDYDGDGFMDHTGIVKSYEYDPTIGKMVMTTIEGNVGGDKNAGNGTLQEKSYTSMQGVAGFGSYTPPPPPRTTPQAE